MSNTTFDVKQAVKYMLDGLIVECIESGNTFKINEFSNFLDLFNQELYTLNRFLYVFEKEKFKLDRKNLVEWYRLKEVWYEGRDYPEFWGFDSDQNWWRCKDECIKFYGTGIKVVEWETKLMPATWEECE